jgi:hypothetical protein
MITVIELGDELIKWSKKAQKDPHAVQPEPFDNLDLEGLDVFDIQALNRYYHSLGNLLNSLANKQKYAKKHNLL